MSEQKIIKNSPEFNIFQTLRGKRVLFLENDNTLAHGLDEFERILQRAQIEYKVLFDLSSIPMEEIKKAIGECDVIVFQTRWVYDISMKLLDYMRSISDKKIVIECYIGEPTWYYKHNHGTHHELYIYKCPVYWGEPDKKRECFYKITDKPYWDYENEFDN